MTDQPSTLAEALADLQRNLPAIKKGSKAQYGRYADLADVSHELLPLLGDRGLSFSSRPTYMWRLDESGDAPMLSEPVFVLAYTLRHVSGEALHGYYPLGSGTPQTLGGNITYARRYALCAVTGAVADEDDDGQAAEKEAVKAGRGKPPLRAVGNLPKNRDGTISRSQVTDDELAAAGAMTSSEKKAHGQLERDVRGSGPQGTQRLNRVPDDDPFYQTSAAREDSPASAPQAPGSESADTPAPLTPTRTPQAARDPAQSIAMYFNRFGITDDNVRYGCVGTLIGRDITSTKQLTAGEGVAVLRALAKVRNQQEFDELVTRRLPELEARADA